MNPDSCKNEECNNKEGYMLFGYCESCFLQESTILQESNALYYYDTFEFKQLTMTESIQGIRIA